MAHSLTTAATTAATSSTTTTPTTMEWTALWMGYQNWVAWAILLYSAIGPGTIADIWQQRGQQTVSASEANILLSLEPVFSALLAFFIMGEVTTPMEGIGGGLILLAAWIATR